MKYSVPKPVQNAAKKALKWHKQGVKGTTPVGLRTAGILAEGGSVDFALVKKISEYFPRHEVDKQAKGWDSDKITPGKKSWYAWGSDAGWKWSKAIVEKNKAKETAGTSRKDKSDDGAHEYEIAPGFFATRMGDGLWYIFKGRGTQPGHKDMGYEFKTLNAARKWAKTNIRNGKIAKSKEESSASLLQKLKAATTEGEFAVLKTELGACSLNELRKIAAVYVGSRLGKASSKKQILEGIGQEFYSKLILDKHAWIAARQFEDKSSIPEEASMQASLSRKLFEVAGLGGSEEEIAWLSKKARVLKNFNKLSGKEKLRRRNADLEKYDSLKQDYKGSAKKARQHIDADGQKIIKPLWANLDRMANAFGYEHAKCLNPRWDMLRQTFDMRVNIECPYLIEAIDTIVEAKMNDANTYGILNSVKFVVNEVGIKRGGYYAGFSMSIDYLSDDGKRERVKAEAVVVSENPDVVVAQVAKKIKDNIAKIRRKNLKALLTRAVNKIKVPK